TAPMGGFDPQQYNEILGLDKLGLSAVVICAAGYRSPDDKYAGYKKVRFDKQDVIIHI
ncbi:MAG: nitroreductase, partial [Pedosphaera sp.]|nr:nitroreductase [Pedosphaera sp.]